jgi:hypothetical protein
MFKERCLSGRTVSDDSAGITGDVVTIDGGAWLAGAGELNTCAMMPPAQIEPMIVARRGPKK